MGNKRPMFCRFVFLRADYERATGQQTMDATE